MLNLCVIPKDIVMLQSALRGHLLRKSQLKDLLKATQNKVSHVHTYTSIGTFPLREFLENIGAGTFGIGYHEREKVS